MPDTNPPHAGVSWLRLPEATPTPEVQEVYDRTEKRIGYVRNIQRTAAHRPALAIAQDALSRAVNSDQPEGQPRGLTAREREMIALVVSAENRCEACIFGHAAALRGITGDAMFVDLLAANWRHAGLSPREHALADYAIRITRAPGEIGPEVLDGLRAAGISEPEILDAAFIAAYFNFSNRVNSSLGVAVNADAWRAHR